MKCTINHNLFLLLFLNMFLNNTLRTIIIIILTCIVSVTCTFFVTKHIYENKLKHKTEGGYKYELFNTETTIDRHNLPIINTSKDSYDVIMKKLEQMIFSDKCPVSSFVNDVVINFEDKVYLFNEEGEDINYITGINYDPYSGKKELLNTFEPDTTILFSDVPNVVFIIENDEGSDFHSKLNNIRYVKKTLNYHNMILHDKDGTKYVIIRITYPISINKNMLKNLAEPVLNYIRNHRTFIFTVLLSSMSGYLLIKLNTRKQRDLMIIRKNMLQEYVNMDKENKIINESNLNEIYDDKNSNNDLIRLTYENIINDVLPLHIPTKGGSTTSKIENNILNSIDVNIIMDTYRNYTLQFYPDHNSCDYQYLRGITVDNYNYRFKYLFYNLDKSKILFDTNYNEEHPNYVISDYDFSKYPESPPVLDPDGFRTMFKNFIKQVVYSILKNTSETYYDRLVLFNNTIFIFIQIYENWYCVNNFGEYIYYPTVCHSTDDFYDDLHVNDILIEHGKRFIMPEFIERIQHPSRIMCNDDIDIKGGCCDFVHVDKKWVIPNINEFNKFVHKYL